MASEEDLAEYLGSVLPKLVEVGATGAMIWCFADYVSVLYHRPPCDEAKHERFFGLVRPDGSLKPHAPVIKRFAETRPKIRVEAPFPVSDFSLDHFYERALANAKRPYELFLKDRSPA